ncbi:MAG: beta-ketoacyl-ACP synthase II [Phycisphaerales bacterium]
MITGAGAVSCFGVGAEAALDAMLERRTGIAEIRAFDASTFAHPFGAELPEDLKVRDYVPKSYRKATKVMARDTEIAVIAAKDAVGRARLVTGEDQAPEDDRTYPSWRFGCQIGAGLIAAEVEELAPAFGKSVDASGAFSLGTWGESGMHNLTPLWLLKYLPNMLACHVTIIHEARGPSNTITNAQASGLLSLGETRMVIERGDADCCLSGSAESKINPMGLERLRLAGLLDDVPSGVDASRVLRPYDPEARTSVVGEGGGILICEERDGAMARGAEVLAEIVGFGGGHTPARGDAIAKSVGLSGAIRRAIADAGLTPDEIDVVFPEAAGAPGYDHVEAQALRAVFGDRLASLPMIAITPFCGHAQAGAGGLKAAIASTALASGRFPAPLSEHTPGSLLGMSGSPTMPQRVRTLLLCTGSMGGQNAALVLRSHEG